MNKNYIKCECGTQRNITLSPTCPVCRYNKIRDEYADKHLIPRKKLNKGQSVFTNTCEWCGKKFRSHKKKQRYCNRQCSAKSREYDLAIKKQQL